MDDVKTTEFVINEDSSISENTQFIEKNILENHKTSTDHSNISSEAPTQNDSTLVDSDENSHLKSIESSAIENIDGTEISIYSLEQKNGKKIQFLL